MKVLCYLFILISLIKTYHYRTHFKFEFTLDISYKDQDKIMFYNTDFN